MVRGIPAIALSADSNTKDNEGLAHPNSKVLANLTLKLVNQLLARGGQRGLLPEGVGLNVNFPKEVSDSTPFAFSRIGTYNAYNLGMRVSNGSFSMGSVGGGCTHAGPSRR